MLQDADDLLHVRAVPRRPEGGVRAIPRHRLSGEVIGRRKDCSPSPTINSSRAAGRSRCRHGLGRGRAAETVDTSESIGQMARSPIKSARSRSRMRARWRSRLEMESRLARERGRHECEGSRVVDTRSRHQKPAWCDRGYARFSKTAYTAPVTDKQLEALGPRSHERYRHLLSLLDNVMDMAR
jgi:hypothetical protein